MLDSPRARLGLLASLLLPGAPPIAGQTPAPLPDRWQLTLNDHSYVWDVRLVKLVGDTLIVRKQDSLIHTPIQHIIELRLLPETILQVGDGHRSAIGALGDNNVPVFDLTPLEVADRRRTIEAILARQASP